MIEDGFFKGLTPKLVVRFVVVYAILALCVVAIAFGYVLAFSSSANRALPTALHKALSPADTKIGHDALIAFIRNADTNGATVTRSKVLKVTDNSDGSRTVRIVVTVEGLGTAVFDVSVAPGYTVVGAKRVG